MMKAHLQFKMKVGAGWDVDLFGLGEEEWKRRINVKFPNKHELHEDKE